MNIVKVLLMAVGLAMDAFAMSLGIGATGRANSARSRFRLSFHFCSLKRVGLPEQKDRDPGSRVVAQKA